MYQVTVCGNVGSRIAGSNATLMHQPRDSCLMHHLQFTVVRVGGPKLMHHDLQDHLMHQATVCGNLEECQK